MNRTPALAWLLWALAAAASIQLAPNPLYVSVVVALAVYVVQANAHDGPLSSAFGVMLAAGVVFAGLRLVLNALTTHGTGDVLVTIPAFTLPRLLGGFTVGGTVETQVVARAAAEGWAIIGIIAAFAAFNAVVSHHELVHAAPRAFYELGLAVTVALAFLPSTIEAIASVREADRARTGGNVVRRGRILRQVVPVLETGMQRAVHLAESMDSRGFGRDASRSERVAGWCGLGALLLLGGSFVALVARASGVAVAMAALGVALVVVAVALSSRASSRSRYRVRRLTRREWVLAGVAWITPIGLALAAAADDVTLRWPGERVSLPPLTIVPVALLVALAVLPVAAGRTR